MRIAVPTDDGASVSPHFGRSSGFLVFEVRDGAILSKELRTNAGAHTHEEGSCAGPSAGQEHHNHANILTSLSGCDVVICAGMGFRAAEALKAGGITPVLTAESGSPEQLVSAFLKGQLPTATESFCRCHH